MAEPQDTVKKLMQSFDKNGAELSRYDLELARTTLTEHMEKQPNNTRLPWWRQRVEDRLHFLESGEARPKPPLPAQSKQEKRAGLIIIGVFVLLVGGCSVAVFDGDDDGSGGGRDDIMAGIMCEDFVKDRLKSPSSADFPSSSSYVVTGAGNQYTVQGYVDAENSFGASLRTDWTCSVRDNGDESWNLVTLTGLD
ncbi:hypothetical protein [Modestobacter sp. SSW1-42]|uniref:hypothetical protein n=1 Tax=Modestobacter sp. SSW1-42 TaxID=596372 RepID=UPI00398770F6